MPVLEGEGIRAPETLIEPIPDLMAEYIEEQISLYGATGTPEELIKMCPVSRENMTIEAKNMFFAMAMNESCAAIKSEHISYFQRIVESRGAELKVTIREEPMVEEKAAGEMESRNAAVKEPNKISKVAEVSVKALKVPVKAGNEQFTDEDTTAQMDAWLASMQQEYEEYERNLSLAPPVSRAAVAAKTATRSMTAATAKKTQRAEAIEKVDVDSLEPITAKPEPMLLVQVIKELQKVEARPTQLKHEKVAEPVDLPHVVPSVDKERVMGSQAELAEEDRQSLVAVSGSEPEAAEQAAEELALAEIFPLAAEKPHEKEPVLLLEQIAEYVEQDETLDVAKTEKVAELISEMRIMVEELIGLKEGPAVVRNEINAQDGLRLEEICADLFDQLGIDYDDELVRRFVQAIINQELARKIEAIETEQAHEKGTHERKTFVLRDLIFAHVGNLPSFHLLGRYVMWRQVGINFLS